LWLIEAWGRGYNEACGDLYSASAMWNSSFIENWKRGKAHKPRLQCFVLQMPSLANALEVS